VLWNTLLGKNRSPKRYFFHQYYDIPNSSFFMVIEHIRGQCYNHYFRRFWPIFGDFDQFSAILTNFRRKNGVLLENQYYIQSFFCTKEQWFKSKSPITFLICLYFFQDHTFCPKEGRSKKSTFVQLVLPIWSLYSEIVVTQHTKTK
jgi:hypothetical protein